MAALVLGAVILFLPQTAEGRVYPFGDCCHVQTEFKKIEKVLAFFCMSAYNSIKHMNDCSYV